MPIIRWSDEYSVGVERIDEEHKTLIDMINKAFDSVSDRDETLKQLTLDMQEYAIMHFSTEDKYMVDYGYPHTKSHLESHRLFIRHAHGEVPLEPIKIIKFLAEWLNSHIKEEDKALGLFLQSKGVR